ncbi:MAG: 50S ribosomal protein L1 [Rickettsiales bacterium]|jgi:large subunit ribosomal protein L1|nr:50S ribosomal protein L1 [Rickettsiales bacterium]
MKVNEDVKKLVDLATAIDMVKKNSKDKQRKFVETVEMIFNLNIDAKQSNQNIRGSVALPAGLGKQMRVIVFTGSETKQQEALKAGAVRAGLVELINEIDGGFMDFDYCIATPDSMKSLSKIAKKLGPRGLMPNPKNGNVTEDVVTALGITMKGKINFKNDKCGIVHTSVGKVDFSNDDLMLNIRAVAAAIKDAKPESIKNRYIKLVYLKTTMGPAIAVDIEKTGGSK